MKKTKGKLTLSEIKRLKGVLEKLKAGLEKELSKRMEGTEHAADREDVLAISVQIYPHEHATNDRVRNLCLVQDAIGRIDGNTFGKCLDCERNIPKKRLEANPWAPFCCECQEKVDAKDFAPSRRKRRQ